MFYDDKGSLRKSHRLIFCITSPLGLGFVVPLISCAFDNSTL